MNALNFENQVVLITGASRGIGQAIALSFAKAKAKVFFTNRNEEAALNLKNQIQAAGGQAEFLCGDVSKAEHCQKVVAQALEQFGKIDFLINNAGVTQDNLLLRMKESEWQQVMHTNLDSVFFMSKACLKPMFKARAGRIINIGSVVGFIGNPGQINYTTTKAGLVGFTKSLAKEASARNIYCNLIAPGFIETTMTNAISAEAREALLKNVPLNKMGQPEDVANGVLFLCSPLANYINGTVLHINGGLY